MKGNSDVNERSFWVTLFLYLLESLFHFFISARLEVGILWRIVFYKEMELIAEGKSVNIWKV